MYYNLIQKAIVYLFKKYNYMTLRQTHILIWLFIFISGCQITQKQDPSHEGITFYQAKRDQTFILDRFKEDWYWLVSEGVLGFDPKELLATQKSFSSKEPIITLVYLEQAKPVGFCMSYISHENHLQDNTVGIIYILDVAPEKRGKGIASQLLVASINKLRQQGAQVIQLTTRTNNYNAQKTYLKNGFYETWRDDRFVNFEKNLIALQHMPHKQRLTIPIL